MRSRRLARDARHQHGKAVASIAAQQVVIAQVQQQHVADGLQHAVAFAVAVFAVNQMEAVDVEQDQRAIEAGAALLFQAHLRAQITGVGQLRDAVEGAVVTEQALALLQVFVQAELFLPPIVHADGQHQHAKGDQRFEPVIPDIMLVDGKEFVQTIGPGTQHDGAQAAGDQARHQAARTAAEGKQKPHAGHDGRAAFADDVHPLPDGERFHLPEGGIQQKKQGQRQCGGNQAVTVQWQHVGNL
ncbi:hypothetical protein JaAD80_28820 [Janthinobacterium sp. AD80]|nr:hypothetical protein JaAD80_28820 [Janthinobacterium sp. AD80]